MSKRMVDLKVKGSKVASINGYEVGGTAVEANPQEEATQQLEKIKIDNIAYNIAGGGAGGGSIVVQTEKSRVIEQGTISNKQWLPDRKLSPNTAYEVGDIVQLYYTKTFNKIYLDTNQIINIMHCYLSFNSNVKLQYGDVVLVPTITDIRPSCSISTDNVVSLSAGCYITFAVVKGGTTGTDVTTPPDSSLDDGAEFIIHTLTTAA